LDLAKQSLGAQIQTLRETQNEFEKENEPYLQVTNHSVIVLRTGGPITIAYNIINLKESPVQIIGKATITTLSKFTGFDSLYNRFCKSFNEIKETEALKKVNEYVIKETPYIDTIHTTWLLPPDYYSNIIRRE
jgi:hypothetical protein